MTQHGLARLDRWLWRVTLPCLLLDIRSVIVQQQGSILITGIEVELLAYVLSRGRESDCFVKPADGSTDIIALSTGEFWEYSRIILLLNALRIRDCYSHLFPEDCCALIPSHAIELMRIQNSEATGFTGDRCPARNVCFV